MKSYAFELVVGLVALCLGLGIYIGSYHGQRPTVYQDFTTDEVVKVVTWNHGQKVEMTQAWFQDYKTHGGLYDTVPVASKAYRQAAEDVRVGRIPRAN